jgi:hypothetical protein
MSTVLTDLTLNDKTYTVTVAEQTGTPSLECPPGQHKDASGNCVPDVVNPRKPLGPSTGNIGPDGVLQIHPTASGKQKSI